MKQNEITGGYFRMKYNGFYFWMFKGSMKKVLAEEYGKTYAAEIMKKKQEGLS